VFGFARSAGQRKKLKPRRKLPLRFDPPSPALPMQAGHVHAGGEHRPGTTSEGEQESLTAFSRTDRTVPDHGVYSGHLAGR
jgi:hypothetical protein